MQRATIDWIWGLQLWEHCCCQVPLSSSAPSVASEQELRSCCEYPAIYKSALFNSTTLPFQPIRTVYFTQFVQHWDHWNETATQKKLFCAWISGPWKFTFYFKVHLNIFHVKNEKKKADTNFLFLLNCKFQFWEALSGIIGFLNDLTLKHGFLLCSTCSLQVNTVICIQS